MELYHHGVKGQKWGVKNGPPYPLLADKDGKPTKYGKQKLYDKDGKLSDVGLSLIKKNVHIDVDKDSRRIAKRRERTANAGITRIDDYTHNIAKGSKMQRLSSQDEETDKKRKYVSLTDSDNQTYSEVFDQLDFDASGDVYELEYTAAKDMNVASSKAVLKYLMVNYGDTPVKDILDKARDQKVYSQKQKDDLNKKIDKYSDVLRDAKVKDVYVDDRNVRIRPGASKINDTNSDKFAQTYFAGMEYASKKFRSQSYKDQKISDKMFKDFSKRGYDAILDIEDGQYFDYPVILLNPKESVKKTNSYKWGD